MEKTDGELIRAYQTGDTSAFGSLYDRYVGRIYDFVYYKVHHTSTAEDIVSIVFMKALENINQYNDTKSSFITWVYTIARNTVIDHYRTHKETLDIEDVWDLAGDASIEKDAETKILMDTISAHMSKLPSLQREVLILRIWADLPYSEISQITGSTEANCKMSFSRAIKQLRTHMPLATYIALLILEKKIYG